MGTFSEFLLPAYQRHEAGRQSLNDGDYSGILQMLMAYPELAMGAVAGGVGELSGYLGQDKTQQRKLGRDVLGMIESTTGMSHAVVPRAKPPAQRGFSIKILDDGRPTEHIVHKSGMDLQYANSPGRWPATDPNSAFRITGQAQIDDMMQSGLVRSKPPGTKAKGGRQGVTHWSEGRPGLVYDWGGNPDSFILQAPSKGLNGRQGAISLDELSGVYQYRDGIPTNILNEIISAKMKGNK